MPVTSALRSTLLAVMIAASTFTVQSLAETRSVTDIEAALNPLEFVANHGGVRRAIDLEIAFALNSATLLPAGQVQVKALAGAMQGERLASYRFQVIGHTDASGGEAHNQQLSEKRAAAVVDTLVKEYGIAAGRLIAEGRGESELKAGLAPESAEHRRVEIVLAADVEPASTGRGEQPKRVEDTPIDW